VLGSFRADDRTTPQQLTEITTALRTLLDFRRITQDTRFNLITVRGLTRQVNAANLFFRTLEKPPGEVFIEVELLEVNTSRARSLGLLPPQPLLLQFLGRVVTGIDPTLFALGGGRTFYGIRLPGASGDLNFASSIVRSYQVLQLRALQDQEANFLLGQRYPVITATVGSGFSADPTASLGFFPQIQYQDIGVTVKTTPHLHAGRELTLVLDLALRDLGASGLNGLPTFTNRQLIGQVRLKEGESFLIGGILSRSQQNSRSGYPLLSRIPLLGYLFSVFRKQQSETELWIHLRPYILRAAPAEEFASRAIFFGKELPGVTPPPVEAVPPAPQPGVPPGVVPPGVQPPQPFVQPQPGQPPQPGVPPQPGAPVVFPPGVFPPGVFPPGVQQPQPGGQTQQTP
jgi:general secretion pathway protein D